MSPVAGLGGQPTTPTAAWWRTLPRSQTVLVMLLQLLSLRAPRLFSHLHQQHRRPWRGLPLHPLVPRRLTGLHRFLPTALGRPPLMDPRTAGRTQRLAETFNLASALPGSLGGAIPAVARTGGAISGGLDAAAPFERRRWGGCDQLGSVSAAARPAHVAGWGWARHRRDPPPWILRRNLRRVHRGRSRALRGFLGRPAM